MIKRKCFSCRSVLGEEYYRVMIINIDTGYNEFVSCCSANCAESIKEKNANIHKHRYESVKDEPIRRYSNS